MRDEEGSLDHVLLRDVDVQERNVQLSPRVDAAPEVPGPSPRLRVESQAGVHGDDRAGDAVQRRVSLLLSVELTRALPVTVGGS